MDPEKMTGTVDASAQYCREGGVRREGRKQRLQPGGQSEYAMLVRAANGMDNPTERKA